MTSYAAFCRNDLKVAGSLYSCLAWAREMSLFQDRAVKLMKIRAHEKEAVVIAEFVGGEGRWGHFSTTVKSRRVRARV